MLGETSGGRILGESLGDGRGPRPLGTRHRTPLPGAGAEALAVAVKSPNKAGLRRVSGPLGALE